YPVLGEDGKPEPGQFLTVATTRPETMLGDVAVAVNPEDERYKHLHGKKLLLPLMGREIPVVTDSWVSSDFGTGAVKVTPAHDPNDFAIGQRHGLPSISVMDDTAHINAEGGKYEGLDRYVARKRVLADLEAQGLLGTVREHTNSIGKCDRCKTVVEPRLLRQWSRATSSSRPRSMRRRISSGCGTFMTGASRVSCGGGIGFRRGTAGRAGRLRWRGRLRRNARTAEARS